MGRQKIHASDAERQRAYRQRLIMRLAATAAPKGPRRPRRPQSRPAKLAAVRATAVQLFDEYGDWLASLPDSLQDTEQAHRLSDTIDQLAAVIDLLSDIDPPRGFGRD